MVNSVYMAQSIDYVLSLLMFILFILLLNELQIFIIRHGIESFIDEATAYEKISKRIFTRLILAHREDLLSAIPRDNPTMAARNLLELNEFKKILRWIDEAMNSFMIYPVTLDPVGIIERLEHILDIRRRRMLAIADWILPRAPEHVRRNLESALEAAMAIRYLWKLTKHVYQVGLNTRNLYLLLQLRFMIPFIREILISLLDALKGFTEGVPLGDTVGALVAQRFFGDLVEVDKETRMAYSSIEIDGRYILAVKAAGPGSEIGYPGRFLERILQKVEGGVDAIITIDAALRFESEATGDVHVGVGAAIGDPGPEKFRIEKWATKYRIPICAVVIKENILETLTPLRKRLLESVEKAYNIVRRIIVEEVPEGGKVIILGIGNSIGSGNSRVI